MTVEEKRTISAEDLMTRLVTYTGFTPPQLISQLRVAEAEKRAFVIIFKASEFTIPLSSISEYLENMSPDDGALSSFPKTPSETVPGLFDPAPAKTAKPPKKP